MKTEKRKFTRIDASIRIDVIPYEVTEEDIFIRPQSQARTKNICAGGILFTNKQPLDVGSLVELQIYLPCEAHPFRMIGEVCRLSRVKAQKGFDVGVAFLKISRSDKTKILRLKNLS